MIKKGFPLIVFQSSDNVISAGNSIFLESTEQFISEKMDAKNTIVKIDGEIEPIKNMQKGWEDTVWVVILVSGVEIYTDALTTKGLINGVAFP